MTTVAKKSRAPRKPKTAAVLAELIKAKELELEKARQEQAFLLVEDKIKNSTLVTEFKKLQAELGSAVTEVSLLAAVGKQLGIKRLSVTQTAPKPRAAKGTISKAAESKK